MPMSDGACKDYDSHCGGCSMCYNALTTVGSTSKQQHQVAVSREAARFQTGSREEKSHRAKQPQKKESRRQRRATGLHLQRQTECKQTECKQRKCEIQHQSQTQSSAETPCQCHSRRAVANRIRQWPRAHTFQARDCCAETVLRPSAKVV